LAGAQPKTALLQRDGRWGDPAGASATTHILKPAVAGLDQHDLNEHLCLAAMRHVGLGAVHSWVERFEEQSAIVVERYDRMRDAEGALRRVHQEDICQALGLHPALKYQNEGGPGPAEVAGLLRRVMPAQDAVVDVTRFAAAMVWNWIIAGTDDHAKNYSLLLAGSQVALAPLYDVASALPYPDMAEQRLRFAMKFGSDYKVNPVTPPWSRLGVDLGLKEDRVREVAARLLNRAVDGFDQAASDPGVVALGSDLPEQMVERVTRRVASCRKLL
jgi:serine/threonine-protein kinase HipA